MKQILISNLSLGTPIDEPVSEAEQVATLIRTGGNPEMPDRYFALRSISDEDLWREAITMLVGMRG